MKNLHTDGQKDRRTDGRRMIIIGLYNFEIIFNLVGSYHDEHRSCQITWTHFVQIYLLVLPRKTFKSDLSDFKYPPIIPNFVGFFEAPEIQKSHTISQSYKRMDGRRTTGHQKSSIELYAQIRSPSCVTVW